MEPTGPDSDQEHRTWESSASAPSISRIFAALAGEAGEPDRLIIDGTHLKAHRTAASLLKRGRLIAASAAPRAG
jgi:ornithine cyclodeaminase/alanine dehydrogenase-like protein (mu-crystallin family)